MFRTNVPYSARSTEDELYTIVLLSEFEQQAVAAETAGSRTGMPASALLVEGHVGIPREQAPGYLARLSTTELHRLSLGVSGGNPDNRGQRTHYRDTSRRVLDLDSIDPHDQGTD